jgi:hypothetical protein
MNVNLDDDSVLEKTFRDASKAFAPPDGLKEGMRASLAGISTAPRTGFVYYRAWLQSPDALDNLLTRDAAVVLRPEPILTDLGARRLLKTMNQIEEEHNGKRSMRSIAYGIFV